MPVRRRVGVAGEVNDGVDPLAGALEEGEVVEVAFEKLAVSAELRAAFGEGQVGQAQIVPAVAVFGEVRADAAGGPGDENATAPVRRSAGQRRGVYVERKRHGMLPGKDFQAAATPAL